MNSEQLNNLSKQITSPVPFWFLNGRVEEWHIVREFDMMADKGIGDVIVHPRYGLQCDYLSDEWFEIFGMCVREAKKRGMCVWIYDELNWPSGTAGNTVQRIDPEYRGKYLAVESRPLSEIDWAKFVPGAYMIAANVEGGIVTKTRVVEDVAAARALTGPWLLFNCTIRYDEFYIDTLSFDAVNCFKRLTYDEYYKRFGKEFGKTIRAVFTDEPSIYWVSVGYDDWNLPYTADYFSTFEARYGYSPVPMIPYLFYPGAPFDKLRTAASFRADYWEHAGFLFNERYHANLGAWCREHGVIYTGHNNHEEPLRYQIRFQGDMFGTMRAMDVPGVDHLQKATLGNSWISIIGHKICSSEAHFDGKARCMSESFGVMDWDTTFENLKRVVDWQYGLGINMLVPHALYHTISSMTKRESPPSFFYQSPHWQDFECFAGYVRRLEGMLVGGRHDCKVAVMYPTSGLWASYQTDRKTVEFEHTDNFLNSLCLELIKKQIDFDLVDFPALQHARLEDGSIRLADEAYKVLIVPATPYMRSCEITRLAEIAAAGVNTTLFHKAMAPLEANLPDTPPAPPLCKGGKESDANGKGGRESDANGKAGSGGCVLGKGAKERYATFARSEELEAVVENLKKGLDDDIQINGGGAEDILAYRRVITCRPPCWAGTTCPGPTEESPRATEDCPDPAVERKITFLLNRSDKHRKVSALIKDYPDPAIYDQETGVFTKLEGHQAGRKVLAQLRFQPNQSYFIVSGVPDAEPPREFASEARIIPIGNLTVRVPYNVASIYQFRYTKQGREPGLVDVRTDPRYMPCQWTADKPDFAAFAGTYEATVTLDFDPPSDVSIRMILDKDFAECDVYVNETRVDLKPAPDFAAEPVLTDFQDVGAFAGHLLRRGENKLKVVSPTKLSEPLRLVGDFRVCVGQPEPGSVSGTVTLLAPGAVDPFALETDYPFYSGTVTYRAEFDLDTPPSHPLSKGENEGSALILDLHDVRDTATVRVNGELVGTRLWAPYAFDIAKFAVAGVNAIEIEVRNNMANLILGQARPFGLRKMPELTARQERQDRK